MVIVHLTLKGFEHVAKCADVSSEMEKRSESSSGFSSQCDTNQVFAQIKAVSLQESQELLLQLTRNLKTDSDVNA